MDFSSPGLGELFLADQDKSQRLSKLKGDLDFIFGDQLVLNLNGSRLAIGPREGQT